MLDGGGDDVFSLAAAQLRGGGNGPVVALRAAGGELKFRRPLSSRSLADWPRAYWEEGFPHCDCIASSAA